MAHFICETCGIGFKRDRSGDRNIRFCSQTCYHRWRKDNNIIVGQFKIGLTPWNKGLKGIHNSPSTEFKPGQESIKKLPVGSVRIWKCKGEHLRAFVKVGEPSLWKLRCLVVWEEHYGSLPKGLVIHHIDKDVLNDDVTNLSALSRAAHLLVHRTEFNDKRIQGIREAWSRKLQGST